MQTSEKLNLIRSLATDELKASEQDSIEFVANIYKNVLLGNLHGDALDVIDETEVTTHGKSFTIAPALFETVEGEETILSKLSYPLALAKSEADLLGIPVWTTKENIDNTTGTKLKNYEDKYSLMFLDEYPFVEYERFYISRTVQPVNVENSKGKATLIRDVVFLIPNDVSLKDLAYRPALGQGTQYLGIWEYKVPTTKLAEIGCPATGVMVLTGISTSRNHEEPFPFSSVVLPNYPASAEEMLYVD